MNTKLTFTPNLFERISMIFARLECKLRYGWLPSSNHKLDTLTRNLQKVTATLLKEVCQYWAMNNVDPQGAYGDPCGDISYTNTLTPALIWLHFRLTLEQRHYSRIEKANTNKLIRQSERQARATDRLMPSWELRRRSQIQRENNYHRKPARFSLNEENSFFIAPDAIFRMLMAFVLMVIMGSFVSYLVNNSTNLINFLARKMVLSGLPFYEALSGVGLALFLAISITTIFCLEIFHRPSSQDIVDYIDASHADIQNQLGELDYTLKEEVIKRIIP